MQSGNHFVDEWYGLKISASRQSDIQNESDILKIISDGHEANFKIMLTV
jgi:hypothetical protein